MISKKLSLIVKLTSNKLSNNFNYCKVDTKQFKYFSEQIKQTKQHAQKYQNTTEDSNLNNKNKEKENNTDNNNNNNNSSSSNKVIDYEALYKKLNIKTKEEINDEFKEKKFYLQYQWLRLQKEKKKYLQDFECPEFTPYQKQENEVIFNILYDFNYNEQVVFYKALNNIKNSRCIPIKEEKKAIPPSFDPNFNDYQEILYSLTPFLSSGYLLGGASNANTSAVATDTKEEVKKEDNKPREKAIVDIKLVGYEQAKKITLIKEFRAMFTLGLKEAKDAVETVDYIVKSKVQREEALELKAKLEGFGAKIELV